MDIILLVGIAVALLLIILTTLYFARSKSAAEAEPAAGAREAPQRLQQRDAAGAGLSRAQLARNQRNRARNAAAAAEAAAHAEQDAVVVAAAQPAAANDSDDDDEAGGGGRSAAGNRAFDRAEEKMGAKKRAKLEAKAEKQAHREAELELREERKKRDELAADERRAADERERAEEQRQEQAEREARELKERQEHEEYLRMKAAFSVEEEGFDETVEADADNLLQQFVEHIRTKKVVLLEDLSRQFKLKTPACIERIQELRAAGTLTGVLDDRGKFIYISEAELKAVALFIRQRGRISIAELAESSNKLISMAEAAA